MCTVRESYSCALEQGPLIPSSLFGHFCATFPPRQLTQDDGHGRVRGEDEGHVGGDAAAPDPDVGPGHLAPAAPEHGAVVDADQHLRRVNSRALTVFDAFGISF